MNNEEILRHKTFEIISWTGCGIALFMIAYYLYRGLPDIVLDTSVLFAGLFTNLFIYYHTRNVTLHTLVGIILFLIFIMSTAPSLGGQVYFWMYALPWIAFFLLSLNVGTLIIILSVVAFVGFIYYIPPTFIKINANIDIIFSFLLVSVTLFVYEILKLRYQREVEEASRVDNLTNVWNRRKFYELYEIEIERSKRYKRPFSLLHIDLDHFKKINEVYGHTLADVVLQQVAEILKGSIRSTDYLFRWSGEEFLVLAQETRANPGGISLAEKLRAVIEKTNFPEVGTLTASIGVTEFNLKDTIDSLLQKVDEALSQAKKSGGNQVTCST